MVQPWQLLPKPPKGGSGARPAPRPTDTELATTIVSLKCERNNTIRKLERQKRRTDKIREAVVAYLDGSLSKKGLQRALDDTDYSETVGE